MRESECRGFPSLRLRLRLQHQPASPRGLRRTQCWEKPLGKVRRDTGPHGALTGSEASVLGVFSALLALGVRLLYTGIPAGEHPVGACYVEPRKA
jgi:hypothetical protein